MSRLLILRHAQAEPHDSCVSDHERPLTAQGRVEASTIGAAARTVELIPDIVLTSSARRALETLHRVMPGRSDARVLDTLYLASFETLLNILRGLGNANSVLLIGHNPGLHDLALHLASNGPAPPDLPTAGLATFIVNGPWRELDPLTVVAEYLLCPADLDPV